MQLLPTAPSTSEDNRQPLVPQSPSSNKEDNQDAVQLTAIPPANSKDNLCMQPLVSQPLSQQSPSTDKKDRQDAVQLTTIPPATSEDNPCVQPLVSQPLSQQSPSTDKEDEVDDEMDGQDTVQLIPNPSSLSDRSNQQSVAFEPSSAGNSQKTGTSRKLSRLKDSLFINEEVDGRHKRIRHI